MNAWSTMLAGVVAVIVSGVPQMTAAGRALERFVVEDGRIAAPLSGRRGDARRGKAIAFDAEAGNCVICHRVPGGDGRFQGSVGPSLAGVASRLDEGQMRLRLVDGSRINPDTIMPAYYRIDGLNRVRAKFAGKPVLEAAQLEDVLAFLLELKE